VELETKTSCKGRERFEGDAYPENKSGPAVAFMSPNFLESIVLATRSRYSRQMKENKMPKQTHSKKQHRFRRQLTPRFPPIYKGL